MENSVIGKARRKRTGIGAGPRATTVMGAPRKPYIFNYEQKKYSNIIDIGDDKIVVPNKDMVNQQNFYYKNETNMVKRKSLIGEAKDHQKWEDYLKKRGH